MKSHLVICDIDDTVLNWVDAFEQYVVDLKRFDIAKPLKQCANLEDWLNADRKTTRAVTVQFNNSKQFGALQPFDNSDLHLKELVAAGYQFVGVTACGTTEKIRNARIKNLRAVFGNAFVNLHCVDLGCSKAPVLSAYCPTVWVDDRFRHAQEGANVGHTAFLIDTVFNQNTNAPNVTRIKSWKEIVDFLGS